MALIFIFAGVFGILGGLFVAYWNARVAGKIWVEAKAVGGWIRLVAWCGAAESAIGFSGIYAIVIGFPLALYFKVDPMSIFYTSFWLAVFLVPVAIGSMLVITIESWRRWYREKSLANLGVAGWNTLSSGFSMDHTFRNMYSLKNAASSVGSSIDSSGSSDSSSSNDSGGGSDSSSSNDSSGGSSDSSSSSSSDNKWKLFLALIVALIVIAAGCWTTYTIMKKYIGTDPLPTDKARFIV